ncbi:MAG: hypothetical protein WDN04_02500 [Rhodospirillales bacterium]
MRRWPKLRDEVEARVVALRDELERDPHASSRRAAQAAERAAAARAERVRQAQERLRELEKAQAERDKKDRIDPKTAARNTARLHHRCRRAGHAHGSRRRSARPIMCR